MNLSERLISEIRDEFPGFRIVPKAGNLLSRSIDLGLKVVTFGGQRTYLSEYHTVLGWTLYVARSWAGLSDVDRAILLAHERVHLRQRRRLTLPVMAFLYLIPFFPIGLAYGRARLEWEAYTETLRATAAHRGVEAVQNPVLRKKIVGRFTGAAYGFMWPFRWHVERWFDQVVAELTSRET